MEKVGIITFLHNDNYGSSLQAYALQRVIREMGMDCEHLDYAPDRAEKIRNLVRSRNHPKLILEGMRKRQVRENQEGARAKGDSFPAFYRRRMRLSDPASNLRELRERSAEDTVLLCGSDQIWNPVWLNPAYFLTFGLEQRKVAYAASLGVSTLPPKGKARKIRRWTADFQAISVREEEGARLFQQMTGRQAEVMPDPVCLLSRAEWEEIAESSPLAEPYLLCYFIGENPAYWERVQQLKAETGWKTLVLPVTAESFSQGDQVLEGMGPEGFLGAVRGAACFCTDSFHGFVFGTIFGVRTEVLRRYRDGDPESKNSRIDQFQRMMKIMSLDEMRERGRRWLKGEVGSRR
jgi:hypothetical protein